MNFKSRKVSPIIAIALIAGAAALVAFFALRENFIVPEEPEVAIPVFSPFIAMQQALDIAFVAARAWHEDAKLVIVYNDDSDSQGRSSDQRFYFASAQAPNKEYEVRVQNRAVASAREVDALGAQGGDLPENGFLSEAEAVQKMRFVPGDENLEPVGASFGWNEAAGEWQWGIQTARGVFSISAERQ